MSVHPVVQHCSTPLHTGPPLHDVGGWQLPAAHVKAGGQALPHPAQFCGSVWVSVHPVWQHVSMPVQAGPPLQEVVGWQFPSRQLLPEGHWKPHWLQLFGSVVVSVQPEAQQVSVRLHAGPPLHELLTHWPP